MQCPIVFRYFHAAMVDPDPVWGYAFPATLRNPHSSSAVACAKNRPTCSGTFPGVPILASNKADETTAEIIGCVSEETSLADRRGCPVELPVYRIQSESEYQFWVAPGGPATSGNSLVYKCFFGGSVADRNCGTFTPAYHNGELQGCFSDVGTECPDENIAGFEGSELHPQRSYQAEVEVGGRLACSTVDFGSSSPP